MRIYLRNFPEHIQEILTRKAKIVFTHPRDQYKDFVVWPKYKFETLLYHNRIIQNHKVQSEIDRKVKLTQETDESLKTYLQWLERNNRIPVN